MLRRLDSIVPRAVAVQSYHVLAFIAFAIMYDNFVNNILTILRMRIVSGSRWFVRCPYFCCAPRRTVLWCVSEMVDGGFV